MSYQKALSQFILHKNASKLHTLFEDGADTGIASIYRNGFFRSCHEVLASTFPTVQTFAGADRFKALAHVFTQAYPPDTGTLTGYGDKFSNWLALQGIKENLFLSQLAQLDWAWIACLHGPDATPLTAESFQTLLAQNADGGLPRISLIKNAHLITSNEKPIHLWLDCKKGHVVNNFGLDIENEAQVVVIWRPKLDVFARVLPMEEASFIKEIAYCKNLNDASTRTLNTHPTFNLPRQFSALLQHGLLSTIRDSHDA